MRGYKPNGYTPSPNGKNSEHPLPRLPTPEQGLLGCGLGLLAFLLAALFWGWIYWRQYQRENNPQRLPAGARGTKIRP